MINMFITKENETDKKFKKYIKNTFIFNLCLTIVFLFLQVIGVINWSWYVLIAPLWVPLFLSISFFALIFAGILTYSLIKVIYKEIKGDKNVDS